MMAVVAPRVLPRSFVDSEYSSIADETSVFYSLVILGVEQRSLISRQRNSVGDTFSSTQTTAELLSCSELCFCCKLFYPWLERAQ